MWTLPDPGIEPVSPALKPDSLPLSHQGSPREHILTGIMVNWNNMQGRMTCLGNTWQPCYHGWPGRRRGQGSWGWSSVFMVKELGFSLESTLTWCPFYLTISSGLQGRCVWGACNLWKSLSLHEVLQLFGQRLNWLPVQRGDARGCKGKDRELGNWIQVWPLVIDE